MMARKKILITGASGALARLVSHALAPKYDLIGVDPRAPKSADYFPGELIVTDYNHRKIDDVFRKHQFSGLMHLGRFRESDRFSATNRFQTNVVGTKRILELCRESGVSRITILSTYHVYGAHRLNSLYLTEDAPLRASQSFPELADAVELDHAATTFLWRHRDIQTNVLRSTNIIGKHVRNTICTMLRSGLAPKIIGFDPLFQFISEKDIARALILAFESSEQSNEPSSGIYNVAGEGVIAFSDAIRIAKAIEVPIPPYGMAPFARLLGAFKIDFPKYLLEYFKYPVVLNDDAFRKKFGFEPKMKTLVALAGLGPEREGLTVPNEFGSGDDTHSV